MVIVKVILTDDKVTNFMQAANLFLKDKAYFAHTLKIKYKSNFAKQNFNILKTEYTKDNKTIAAIFSDKKIYYKNLHINYLSNGKFFTSLDNLIHAHMRELSEVQS